MRGRNGARRTSRARPFVADDAECVVGAWRGADRALRGDGLGREVAVRRLAAEHHRVRQLQGPGRQARLLGHLPQHDLAQHEEHRRVGGPQLGDEQLVAPPVEGLGGGQLAEQQPRGFPRRVVRHSAQQRVQRRGGGAVTAPWPPDASAREK